METEVVNTEERWSQIWAANAADSVVLNSSGLAIEIKSLTILTLNQNNLILGDSDKGHVLLSCPHHPKK